MTGVEEQEAGKTAPMEVGNLEAAVILTGLSLLLQSNRAVPAPPEVITAIESVIGKLTDVCQEINGNSPELDHLRASRLLVQAARAMSRPE